MRRRARPGDLAAVAAVVAVVAVAAVVAVSTNAVIAVVEHSRRRGVEPVAATYERELVADAA